MRPTWPFWKHRASKMSVVEAQCAHRKHCNPETPLGSHPTQNLEDIIVIKNVTEQTKIFGELFFLKTSVSVSGEIILRITYLKVTVSVSQHK